MESIHTPVLLSESIDALLDGGGKVYIDCTVGTGGHSMEILSKTPEDTILIGIDKDKKSLEVAKHRLSEFGDRVKFISGGYENIDELIEPLKLPAVSGILFDLGMSSYQLDNAGRGFSFREEGPLDMRFDAVQKITAEQVINTFSQERLLDVLTKLGEEKWSRRLSRVIAEQVKKKPFETTVDLSDFVRRNIPRRAAHKTLARVFQAIRITVNDELENLKIALFKAFKLLAVDGRIALISYHSLEDRIAKNFFRTLKKAGYLTIINPRCARPSKAERIKNRRSRSARLRVIKKLKHLEEELEAKGIKGLEGDEDWEEEND